MKLEMTELGPIKRALKIEVPAEEITRRFAKAYGELNRQVHIPGFRPGKAPLALLEKRFAKTVEENVLRGVVPDFYDRAIKEAGISPVMVEIQPLDRTAIKKDAPFTFTATVEIKPTFELRGYKAPDALVLKRDQRTVTDEQVDRAIEVLREQQARLEGAPAGTLLAEGDYAVITLEGFLDGQPLEGTRKENQLHHVGSKATVLGINIDSHLMGKGEGEVVEIAQPYPASHPDARVAGRTVMFRLCINAIKQKKLPPVDDEFAKDCGPYASLQELKDKLRGEMEQALKKEIEASYKEAILSHLANLYQFDLPESLVERELDVIVRQRLQERQRGQGSGPARADEEEIRQLRETYRETAKRRVKVSLILEAIAEKEGLSVTEEDLHHEVARLASELRLPLAELVKMIQAGGRESIEKLRTKVLEDKAVDFVYRQAIIEG
ncbi:MAG: trigger factor [Nitrospira sp.]|nr:trigger factor [Nitrospira sp.]